MATVPNKVALDPMLKTVLSVGNQEQTLFYPPQIYEQHYNAVSSYLLSKISEIWPSNQRWVDIINPFLKVKKIPITNGFVQMPDDLRNFLDAGVSVFKDFTGECGQLPKDVLEVAFQESVKKGGCLSRPVRIVDQSEWDTLTTHSYKAPTYKDPIGCFFEAGKLKICPFELSYVEVRYLIKENTYRYGYIMQPDDTYINNPATTIETEWQTNAFELFFKGLNTLYGIYSRDPQIREFGQELKQLGLI